MAENHGSLKSYSMPVSTLGIDDLGNANGQVRSLTELKGVYPRVKIVFFTYERLIRSVPQMRWYRLEVNQFRKLNRYVREGLFDDMNQW